MLSVLFFNISIVETWYRVLAVLLNFISNYVGRWWLCSCCWRREGI